jgi:hypothetical protein
MVDKGSSILDIGELSSLLKRCPRNPPCPPLQRGVGVDRYLIFLPRCWIIQKGIELLAKAISSAIPAKPGMQNN